MQSANLAAAEAAEARAAACRSRVAELAGGRPVGAGDVQRARASAQEAVDRASRAERRLAEARLRGAASGIRMAAPVHRDTLLVPPDDVPELRQRALRLNAAELFAGYFALGGNCAALELEAFLHAAIELPAAEVAVIAHAVWELTEL